MRDCGVYFYCELEVKLDLAAMDLTDLCLPITWTFNTQTQVSACLAHCGQICWSSDAPCCDDRTALMNQIIRVKIPPCGLFFWSTKCIATGQGDLSLFCLKCQTFHHCSEVFPCCVSDDLPRHVLNPFYALVLGFTAVFISLSLCPNIVSSLDHMQCFSFSFKLPKLWHQPLFYIFS